MEIETAFFFQCRNSLIEKPSQVRIMLRDKLNPAGIYLLKVNNRNTRARCEICSKL